MPRCNRLSHQLLLVCERLSEGGKALILIIVDNRNDGHITPTLARDHPIVLKEFQRGSDSRVVRAPTSHQLPYTGDYLPPFEVHNDVPEADITLFP